MMPLFAMKEKFSVGLDIGSSSIKLAKLKLSKGGAELCGFALETNISDLATAIKNITQPQNVNRVNLSLSGPATVIRYVTFPKMSDEELKQSLKFEASKHIPFPLNEINLDTCILREDLPDNKMLIMLAVAKKAFIDQRLKLMQDLRLKVNVFDIDSPALINAFNFNYSGEDALKNRGIALLNIGASLANLSILEKGIPCLSRDIQVGGAKFTQKLADTFRIEFSLAENLKINPDREKADRIASTIEPVLANLAAEVRASFDYYENQNSSSVVKILLSGGGSRLSGLKDVLANLLGIEVEHWDPLKRINITGNIDAERLKAISPQMAVAIGLALRET